MNIYQSLAMARVELKDLKLKKTGNNQNITYYELGDFIPAIVDLCVKYDLFTKFDIVADRGKEKALLTVINTVDSTEKMTFVMPTAEVSLPRGQAIQGLGAKQTYLRRYMYYAAFEIIESEAVDSIKRDLTEEVSLEDQEKIKNTTTIEELTKICGELKLKYKISLITPLFDEQKKSFKIPKETK